MHKILWPLICTLAVMTYLMWPYKWYDISADLRARVNTYTGYGCACMRHDSWGQFPLMCIKDIESVDPPR